MHGLVASSETGSLDTAGGRPIRLPAGPDDVVQPFRIERSGLRGRLVRLGPSIHKILTQHAAYPPAVRQIVGEAIALAAALARALKFEGVLTVQIKGDGPIRTMVADVTSAGDMRGYASFDAERLPSAPVYGAAAQIRDLFGKGYLAITVDQGADTERYQGIVELTGRTLGEAAGFYFTQSEQLRTSLKLACAESDGIWRAGALMLQRVPEEGGIASEVDLDEEDEDWTRARLLMDTARGREILDPEISGDDLLFRLFHEDGARVFTPQKLAPGCRCSAQRVTTILRSLTREELTEMTVDHQITATCEFCGTTYAFTEAELETLV